MTRPVASTAERTPSEITASCLPTYLAAPYVASAKPLMVALPALTQLIRSPWTVMTPILLGEASEVHAALHVPPSPASIGQRPARTAAYGRRAMAALAATAAA